MGAENGAGGENRPMMSEGEGTAKRKAGLYCFLSVALLLLSWWQQAPLTLEDPAPFLSALSWLTVAGVVLLAVGILLRRGADARFWQALGGATLLCGLVLYWLYGGMEDSTAAGADVAMNLLMCLWTLLPLACLIRTGILCFGAHRKPLLWLWLLVMTGLVVLLLTGQLMHFVHPDPESLLEFA